MEPTFILSSGVVRIVRFDLYGIKISDNGNGHSRLFSKPQPGIMEVCGRANPLVSAFETTHDRLDYLDVSASCYMMSARGSIEAARKLAWWRSAMQ